MASNNEGGTGTNLPIQWNNNNKMNTEPCQYGFPGDKRFLDFIQNELITDCIQGLVKGIFGEDATGIVSGCNPKTPPTQISPGFVLINGILLPFAGGVKQTYVKVEENNETATFYDGGSYTAYRKAVVVFTGSSVNAVAWETLNKRLNVYEYFEELKIMIETHSHLGTSGGSGGGGGDVLY